MTLAIPFDNSFARLDPGFFARQLPIPVKAPELLEFNDDLARILGISKANSCEQALVFAGNKLPDGAEPLAQLYAGHQFGNYNPQLGDGRAVLLGEVVASDGQRRDIQLKGSGPTPFSRGGDGRAWLGPVLREYVVSEAMFALGVPTTRALAVVASGEDVVRESYLPGAILTRVAASHLRVGTFQIYAARGDLARLQQLTDYAISRHYPDAQGPMEFLRAVRDKQAELIAAWMSFGFIHGVMNTDNCSISGETIDYGPCAFMDVFHPDTVFSSIDQQGRYAFSSQPDIAVWNLAQLAISLIQLSDNRDTITQEATEIVQEMPELINAAWLRRFRAKLGLRNEGEQDRELIENLLKIMANGQADFTNTFRALGTDKARDQFVEPATFDAWNKGWQARCQSEKHVTATLHAANPAFIARNHRVEQMIAAALEGDLAPFHQLNRVLSAPFQDQPENSDLRHAPKEGEVVRATFCGT